MRLFVLVFVLVTATLASPGATNVFFETVGDSSQVSLCINNRDLKAPLVIADKPHHTIFYQTVDEKVEIIGQPFEVKKSPDGVVGKWRDRMGRTVIISAAVTAHGCTLKFQASPETHIQSWGISLSSLPDEFFCGLFDAIVDHSVNPTPDHTQRASWLPGITQALDLRGQTVNMSIMPSLIYCPFYYSSAGYGLLAEGTWPGQYDFCKTDNHCVRMIFQGPSLTLTFFFGKTPLEIIAQHTLRTGPPILPPRWAFSCWRWRDEHLNLPSYYDGSKATTPYCSQVVEDILMMRALDIPCGVYWIDRPWAQGDYGYDDFQWDSQRLPRHEEMIRWLEQKNIKLLLWLAPWVNGRMIQEGSQKDYFVRGQQECAATQPLVDFTRPAARQWWQDGLKTLLQAGVAGFKLDRSEESTPSSDKTFVFDGRSTMEIRNDYPRQYIEAVSQVCRKVRGDDFVCLARAGYTGSTKYGIFWGGDIPAGPWGLRNAIVALQRSAVMGYPFWGSDTGGYWGGLERENLARWIAFSCFNPIFEVGPTNNRGLWNMEWEPAYDAELIAIWRLYAKLHTALMDYTYRNAQLAQKRGIPIVRPLFTVYPHDPNVWSNWQTYLYGPDLLVTPIWENQVRQCAVYLPEGQWIDAWNPAKVMIGGGYVTVETPLHKIPIFIRKNAKITLGDLNELYQQSLGLAKKRPDIKALERAEFPIR